MNILKETSNINEESIAWYRYVTGINEAPGERRVKKFEIDIKKHLLRLEVGSYGKYTFWIDTEGSYNNSLFLRMKQYINETEESISYQKVIRKDFLFQEMCLLEVLKNGEKFFHQDIIDNILIPLVNILLERMNKKKEEK